jgi:hypothetical protein
MLELWKCRRRLRRREDKVRRMTSHLRRWRRRDSRMFGRIWSRKAFAGVKITEGIRSMLVVAGKARKMAWEWSRGRGGLGQT